MERAVLTAKDDTIHYYNLPPTMQTEAFPGEDFQDEQRLSFEKQVTAASRHILENALKRHNGNQAAAGRELELSPRMMNYHLKKTGLR